MVFKFITYFWVFRRFVFTFSLLLLPVFGRRGSRKWWFYYNHIQMKWMWFIIQHSCYAGWCGPNGPEKVSTFYTVELLECHWPRYGRYSSQWHPATWSGVAKWMGCWSLCKADRNHITNKVDHDNVASFWNGHYLPSCPICHLESWELTRT